MSRSIMGVPRHFSGQLAPHGRRPLLRTQTQQGTRTPGPSTYLPCQPTLSLQLASYRITIHRGGYTGTAAAAVTLINTNGTYSVNGNSYPNLDPNGSNFDTALISLGTHEAGHGFGLGDQGQCGDVMSTWGPVTTSNPSGGTNNKGGCQNGAVTGCDNTEIQNNPNGLYSPGSSGA